MYKVLIVEDEMLVRLGIRNSIDWEKFNMTVVADASNGQIGWELYHKERPNLVITDLKMPVMGGMELITKIRQEDKETRIVILTCVEEFETARQAVTMNVSEYILKLTMSQEEIEKVLLNVKNELDGQITSNCGSKATEKDKSLIKESMLKDYLFHDVYSDEKFGNMIKELNLMIAPKHLVMLMMEIDHYENLRSKPEDDRDKLKCFTLLNVLEEVIAKYKKGEVFFLNEKNYLFILSFQELHDEQYMLQEIDCIINDVKNVMGKFLNISVTFSISGIKNGYMSLKTMYQECQSSLKSKFFEGVGAVIAASEPERRLTKDKSTEEIKTLLREIDGIPDMNRREIESRINHFIQHLPTTKTEVQRQMMQWIHWPVIVLQIEDENMAHLVTTYGERLLYCETLNEIIALFREYFSKISAIYKNAKSLSTEVAETVNCIHSNYEKNITLQTVSENVQLSPNYLTSLLKKELNCTFIEYLTKVRINKSKELLLKTYLKSYEIAEKVGFTDGSYFSRTFYKMTGVRPNEFRRKWVTGWTEDGCDDKL